MLGARPIVIGLSILAAILTCCVAWAEDLVTSPAMDLHKGSLVIVHRPGAAARELVIHFHGAVSTVRPAHERINSAAVLAIVNFPGLSSAYSQPFATDPALLDEVLRLAWEQSRPKVEPPSAPAWERLTLSSFSAGYGATREILKQPAHFDRVDAIFAADSIYAGLLADQPERRVDPVNMQDFLRFATLACDRRKQFVISHSAQPTSYASTTETADYLLQQLQIARQPTSAANPDVWSPVTRAERGRFVVLGFAGETGQDHMRHLRQLDVIWQAAPVPK